MAKSFDEIVSQMTASIKGIREAVLGIEVREHIASGIENVLEVFKQLSDAVTNAKNSADAAAKSATAAANAKSDALTAISSSRDSALSAIDTKKTSSVSEVNAAQTSAVKAVTDTQASAVSAVQKAGAETLGSIPEDYTNLLARVVELESCGLVVKNGVLCAVYDDGTGGDVSVEHIALGYPGVALAVGESRPVSAVVSPEDATNKTVTWKVSPEGYATVTDGVLKATKHGSCTLTATAGSETTSCPVTVSAANHVIETAHNESGEIPAWDAAPSHAEFYVPLTAKKSGLLLRSMSFRIKGFVAGKSRAILKKAGTGNENALVDISLELIQGYNDVTLDMGDFPLEKGVEYQLFMSAVNNFYPPSVEPEWVVENDFIDIANASAYYDDDSKLIFAGKLEIIQEEDNG